MPLQRSNAVDASDDVESLYFNPFVGSSSQTSFSSAYTPKGARSGSKPTLRRRGSEGTARRSRNDHDPLPAQPSSSSSVHLRSRTMDAVVGNSSGTNLHPLAASNLGSTASSSQSSLADTRPRLKRLLSNLETSAGRRGDEEEESRESARSPIRGGGLKERVVVVHEIMPKDSLAGVALRYGISLADLRKANQLWPSDPIHLRKVLYIPLDKSHKAKELVLSQLELNSAQSSEDALPAAVADEKLAVGVAVNGKDTPLTIRRIPASQLSFFPPSSTSSTSLSSSSSRTMPRSAQTARRHDPIPFEAAPSSSSAVSASSALSIPSSAMASVLAVPISNSPSGRGQIPSLSTLFGSLPLGRISFDSSTSTPSQISDDQEHEMHDVSHRNSFDENRERRPDRQHVVSPKASPAKSKKHAQQDAVELRSYSPTSTGPFPLKTPVSGGLRSMPTTPTKRDKSAVYVSPERNILIPEAIRTSQLEPSPMMRLPLKPRGDRDG